MRSARKINKGYNETPTKGTTMKIARRISRRIRTTQTKPEMNYDQIINALLPIG